jgi:uncharacterized lipoprotein YehR (DUF1307 family)
MKKFTKVLALVVVASMLCLILASCGALSGKYEYTEYGITVAFEFKGKNVTLTLSGYGSETNPVKGTYEIKDDKISFDFTNEDYSAIVNDILEELQGELAFEKGSDYIKIAGQKYTKAK